MEKGRLKRILRFALGLALVFIVGTFLISILVPMPPVKMPQATRIYDASGKLVSSLFEEFRSEVPLSRIPENLKLAVLAMEDARFYKHFGVDFVAIIRAAWRDLLARRVVEGGSTISQQLVKDLFLTHERTFVRKIVELFYTFKLEMLYSKDQILEMYLNQIYFGKGAYGVEAASRVYFNKSVQGLSLSESAFLAALIRSPETYSANLQEAAKRRAIVLDRMVQMQFVSREAAEKAKKEPIKIAQKPAPPRQAPYFVDYVTNQVRARHPDIYPDLYRGGYKIYTTLDAEMQAAAEDALKELRIQGTDNDGIPQPQVAITAVDPKTGFIKAMVGGTDFSVTQRNRAVDALRQPGSAFKFFLYTAVIDQWIPPTAKQVCEPVSYPGRTPDEPWVPTDYGREPYHWRPMGIREAIAISDNVVASKWASQIGPSTMISYARRMGINSALRSDLSIALGTSEVSPLEFASALAPLANGGNVVKPLAIVRIEDRWGRIIEENVPRLSREFDPRVMYVVTDLFKSVLAPGGTGARLASIVNRPVAGKTGTTDAEMDAWFVGYTPDLVGVVWVGWDHRERSAGGTGAQIAGPIWAHFMRDALKSIPPSDFLVPPGVIHLDVCSITGFLPNETCPTVREVFIEGTEPRQVDPVIHWTPPPEVQPSPGSEAQPPQGSRPSQESRPECGPPQVGQPNTSLEGLRSQKPRSQADSGANASERKGISTPESAPKPPGGSQKESPNMFPAELRDRRANETKKE